MLPDRVSNPGPLTYESGALPIALRGPAIVTVYEGYFFLRHYLHHIMLHQNWDTKRHNFTKTCPKISETHTHTHTHTHTQTCAHTRTHAQLHKMKNKVNYKKQTAVGRKALLNNEQKVED